MLLMLSNSVCFPNSHHRMAPLDIQYVPQIDDYRGAYRHEGE